MRGVQRKCLYLSTASSVGWREEVVSFVWFVVVVVVVVVTEEEEGRCKVVVVGRESSEWDQGCVGLVLCWCSFELGGRWSAWAVLMCRLPARPAAPSRRSKAGCKSSSPRATQPPVISPPLRFAHVLLATFARSIRIP